MNRNILVKTFVTCILLLCLSSIGFAQTGLNDNEPDLSNMFDNLQSEENLAEIPFLEIFQSYIDNLPDIMNNLESNEINPSEDELDLSESLSQDQMLPALPNESVERDYVNPWLDRITSILEHLQSKSSAQTSLVLPDEITRYGLLVQ